jgi:hypothetical protein
LHPIVPDSVVAAHMPRDFNTMWGSDFEMERPS